MVCRRDRLILEVAKTMLQGFKLIGVSKAVPK
jgi:hypothetical protein